MSGQDLTAGGVALTLSRIQFVNEPITWRDAIRLAGRPLVDEGAIATSYIDAVIATAEQMGPYFDFGHGVAMPHARPEAGVHEIAISYLRVRPSVLLLDREDHAIEVFIVLAATDANTHMDVLRGLANVLMDPERRQALKDATTAEDVLAVFGAAPAS